MRAVKIFGRGYFFEPVFNRARRFAGRQARSVRDAEYVRVDSDRRQAECDIANDIGCFAPHPRQSF